MITSLFVSLGIGGVAVLSVFCLSMFGYEMYAFFGPKYAATERKIFENTKSYNDGMIRDFENIKLQYLSANHDQKDALRATILHRFSVYPRDQLPPDLQRFYSELEIAQ